MPLLGWDHIEFYVGNAKQAAFWYEHALGFRPTAYAGPETGVRNQASYVLEQGAVRIVLTSPLRESDAVSAHLARHGDGVKDIALLVPDATEAYRQAVQRGARGVAEPHTVEDDHGAVVRATIAAYGDTVHTFVDRHDYGGPYLPGYQRVDSPVRGDAGLIAIDHVVANVELGRMDDWVAFYERVFGMTEMIHFSDKDIGTEYSALMSKVMSNGNGYVKFPINEPAEGRRKSQIEEYLEFYQGPGVQHIALATDDILATVSSMQAQGVEFLTVPHTYYTELAARIGRIDEPIEELERLGILVDRDDEGYMLQIFTRPVEDRPTLFYEIIQRKGSRSFGKGNFKALFEAIEREQALRGNL
jgi:4-hydroxyphenylpyruvate dioxygenase